MRLSNLAATAAVVAVCSISACQNVKKSSDSKDTATSTDSSSTTATATETETGTSQKADEAPAFELGECGAEAESFEGELQVTAEVEGQAFGAQCVAGKVETDRLGTTADGLAYNVVCKSADESERLSFWIKGFTAATPFGTRDNWQLLPNVSLQLDTPAGQLKRDSFGPQPEHVLRLGGIIWTLDAPEVKATPPFPDHRLKGCLEGKFAAHETFKNGSIKVLFDLTAR